MNQGIAFLTGLHVLVHSIFGCCTHTCGAHSRDVTAEERCDNELKAATVDQYAHHCAESPDGHSKHSNAPRACDTGSSAERPAALDQRHECRHASCAWLITIAGARIAPVDRGCLFVSATVAVLTEASHVIGSSSAEIDVSRPHALPLRLHLAIGVLII